MRLVASSNTYTQHCRLVLGPPNFGLSRQFMHLPQSSTCAQPLHSPHLRDRSPKQFREGRRSLRGFCSGRSGLSGSQTDPTPTIFKDKLNSRQKKNTFEFQVGSWDLLWILSCNQNVLYSSGSQTSPGHSSKAWIAYELINGSVYKRNQYHSAVYHGSQSHHQITDTSISFGQ